MKKQVHSDLNVGAKIKTNLLITNMILCSLNMSVALFKGVSNKSVIYHCIILLESNLFLKKVE